MERLTVFDRSFNRYKARIDGGIIYSEPGTVIINGVKVTDNPSWLMGEIVERLAHYENTIVYCKDCIHRHSSEFCECRPPDGFCNDGERSGADAH